MKRVIPVVLSSLVALALLAPPSAPASKKHPQQQGKKSGAGADIGNGSADIPGGAAKGAGSVAGNTAKGAGQVATLHPVAGATDVGKGAVNGGKDASVGAVKGTGKVARGTGKGIKKIF